MLDSLFPEDLQVLNECTRTLTRKDVLSASARDLPESWRFPLIALPSNNTDESTEQNVVTFVYRLPPGDAREVYVLGTFASLHELHSMRHVLFQGEDSGYRAASFKVPKAQLHTYLYLLDGEYITDPINPNTVRMANGREWSRFFTDAYLQPVMLESWSYGSYIGWLSRSCRFGARRGKTCSVATISGSIANSGRAGCQRSTALINQLVRSMRSTICSRGKSAIV